LTDVTQRWQSASEVADALRAVHQELTSHKNWWQRQHWASKVAMMLPFILLIGFSAKEIIFPPSTEELIQRQVTEARKIAVLPFENISGDPLLQIFNDGLVATLNRDLTLAGRAQGDGSTWVVPAGEIRRMDNPGVQQVADKYGVDIVLTGSVQHLGSTRHLVMDLIDARDGLVLKSTELNIDAKQLFDGQNSVRQAVIELLDWSIPESLAQQFNATRPTLDGAYREYLSGMGYMYRTDQTRGLENAINAFRNALAIEPGYQNAYEGLATAQIYSYLWTENSEWLDKAADTLSKLTELNADHTGISFLSAELARHKGEYQQSLPLYLLSIEKSPQHAASYSGLAKTYEQLGDFEKALITYQNAIQRFPYNGILHVNLGNLHFRKGDYAKALAQYQRLAKLSPNNSMAYMNAAAAYYSLGDIDNAITYTRKSLDIKEDGDTYSNLGTMLFYIERYDQAVVAYEKAVSFGDKSHHLWGNLADAYKMTNNDKQSAAYQQAMVLAEEALQLNPKNITAAANIAYYLANLGDRERAINYVESLGRNINGINHFFVALTYDQLGMIDESLAHLELAINKNFPVEEIINSPLLPASRSDARFSQLGNDLLKRQ
ncbi:MAG: tetratricopeptide repeat protein, partial [bacterium]